MSHTDARVSAAAMRDRIDALIAEPPSPLRAAWGTTPAAARGARAAIESAGGPAPELTAEQRADRERRKAELVERQRRAVERAERRR